MDTILLRIGITFTKRMSSAFGVVLLDNPINRLGLGLTQEPVLAGSIDPDNPLDVLLDLPHAHYMERRSRGGNDDNHGSLFMHMHCTESLGEVLGGNQMRGHDVVFVVENSRV